MRVNIHYLLLLRACLLSANAHSTAGLDRLVGSLVHQPQVRNDLNDSGVLCE